jgi:hypothetical protein
LLFSEVSGSTCNLTVACLTRRAEISHPSRILFSGVVDARSRSSGYASLCFSRAEIFPPSNFAQNTGSVALIVLKAPNVS